MCVCFVVQPRQEVGGSRWQYGGGGKLRTFRSKDDLVETQGAGGHKSSRDSKHGSATTSRKAVCDFA